MVIDKINKEITIDYKRFKKLYLNSSNEVFILFLQSITGEDILGFSLDWAQNKKYICKAGSDKSDWIISWE